MAAPADDVSLVDDAAKRLNATLLNLARGDGDVSERVGYRSPGSSQKDSHHTAEEKKRREAETKFAMDQARKALDEHIQRLKDEIAESDRKVAAWNRKIAALAELKRLHDSGKLDPNDPAQAALIRAAGLTASDLEGDDAGALLDTEITAATRSRDAEIERGSVLRDRLSEAEDLSARMDADPDSPELQAEALRLRATTPGVQKLGAATFQADSAEAKATVAAIVAKGEDADVQAESAVFNGKVVSDVVSVADTGGASFSFDDPPTQSSVAEGVAPTPIAAPPLSPQFALAADPALAAPKVDDPQLTAQLGAQPTRSMNG
ncbi:chromosome segregation ATPase [Caulobacter ginsengisoli]|uniref:Chromosome segregation ATPase n=1 Tax=Caulobacter ginsengisoli TaxID=400775 RepID=A0ABU0IWM4_9CAUL|nr:hypothetical protein [Caulobacter ginsengisoli]MDQ0465568.1 chromosome segregation ATPase [Caulobacter ginsengisoli]